MSEKVDAKKAFAQGARPNTMTIFGSTIQQVINMSDGEIYRALEYLYPKTLRENTEAFENELARATEALDDFIEMRLLDAMNEDIEKAAEDAKDAFAKAMAEERVAATAFSKEQEDMLTEFAIDAR